MSWNDFPIIVLNITGCLSDKLIQMHENRPILLGKKNKTLKGSKSSAQRGLCPQPNKKWFKQNQKNKTGIMISNT